MENMEQQKKDNYITKVLEAKNLKLQDVIEMTEAQMEEHKLSRMLREEFMNMKGVQNETIEQEEKPSEEVVQEPQSDGSKETEKATAQEEVLEATETESQEEPKVLNLEEIKKIASTLDDKSAPAMTKKIKEIIGSNEVDFKDLQTVVREQVKVNKGTK